MTPSYAPELSAADFNYSAEISEFVRYMPAAGDYDATSRSFSREQGEADVAVGEVSAH
jgi:hypothetical protein